MHCIALHCIASGTAVKDKAHLQLHSRVASDSKPKLFLIAVTDRNACACFLAQFFTARLFDAPYLALIIFCNALFLATLCFCA